MIAPILATPPGVTPIRRHRLPSRRPQPLALRMPHAPLPARRIALSWAAILGCLLPGAVARGADFESNRERVAIESATQRWHACRDPDGTWRLRSEVRVPDSRGGAWRGLFDAGLPLVSGADFDLVAEEATAERVGPGRVRLRLSGRERKHRFGWEATVDLDDSTPLAHLRVECRLEAALVLRGLEPQFALWCRRPGVAMRLDQGTASIDTGSADTRWGNAFPAAWFWDDGVEAALFVVGESLDWMSPRNLYRFRDTRVAVIDDADAGRTGLGLRVVSRNFHELAAGTVSWEAWIDAAACPRPSRGEASGRLLRRFAPLHPAAAVPLVDRFTGAPASWSVIAAGVDADLRRRGIVWDEIELPAGAPWTDAPLFPEDAVTRFPVSTDYALRSACDPTRDRAKVADGWDFTTCHAGLGLWLVHDRLRPDALRRRFLDDKLRAMRLFLDADTGLIRHGTRVPAHVGEKEMAWQGLMNAIETARVWRMARPGARDPAIGGMALIGSDGLVDLARDTDHLLPQWYDAATKRPLPQADQPALGVVHEPWQLGSYAWLLTEARAIDGDPARLAEARTALERLFAPLTWRVTNARYDVAYEDPADWPVTEIFGNAWGVAACCRLEAIDGAGPWRERGDAFLDSLLRQTAWYESALRDDPRDRAVRNAGLFRNHAGAFTGSPWENAEAALALSVRLRADLLAGRPPREPLLGLCNLARTNAATFFPRCCPPEALACTRLADHPCTSLPIEDAYTPEHGGLHGGMGLAAYMAGSAFAWDLLFEALATADDTAVMVMNLDAIEGAEQALAGFTRHTLVHDPRGLPSRPRIVFRHLPPGRYRLSIDGVDAGEHSREALADGVPIAVAAGGHRLLTLGAVDAEDARAAFEQERREANRLATEWAALHRDLRRDGWSAGLESRRDAWRADRDRLRAAWGEPVE